MLDKRIHKIADSLNIKLNPNRNVTETDLWNGEDIAIRNESNSEVIHEIAHWLVATPRQRKLVNFGLGDLGFGAGAVIKTHDKVESQASILGICIEAALGLIYETSSIWALKWLYIHSLEEHNWLTIDIDNKKPEWNDIGGYDVYAVLRSLRNKKLLINHTPKVLLDIGMVRKVDKPYLKLNYIKKKINWKKLCLGLD